MRYNQPWADSIWGNGWKYIYTYDTNRLVLTYTEIFFSGGQWFNNMRFIYNYDINGNILENILQQYDTAWVNYHRTLYTRDINGNMLTQIEQYWQNSWINNQKYTYTYDAYGNSITGKYETVDQLGDWRPSADEIPVYSDNVEIYTVYFVFRYEAHFKSSTSGMNNYKADKVPIVIYPNPANDYITLSCPSMVNNELIVKVYNIQGKMLLQQKSNQDKTEIDISGLAKGLYIVTVIGNDINISEKIIKE
jgi:hypothetical protein